MLCCMLCCELILCVACVVAIMSTLRHPNVLLFMGACTQPGNLLIVTELMCAALYFVMVLLLTLMSRPRGSVYDLLRDSSLQLSLKRKMLFAKDAALGAILLGLSFRIS